MKKIFFLVVGLAGFIVSRGQQVINDPNAVSRSLNGSFHAIRISDGIDLYLSQDDKEAVAVSAVKTEYRDAIRVEVENGVLKIWYDKKGGFKWWKGLGNQKMKAYVSFRQIDGLNASGASDVYVNGVIKAGQMNLVLSGASDFKEGRIEADVLKVDLSGASDARLGGRSGRLEVEASGASDFHGYDFVTDNCSANASGASSIQVTVNKELVVRASGASDVHFRGDASIRDLKSSGASSVSRRS